MLEGKGLVDASFNQSAPNFGGSEVPVSCDDLMNIGEIAIAILSFLDRSSLVRAAQVSRSWNVLAGDNSLWYLIAASLGFQVDASRVDQEPIKSQVKQIQEDKMNGIEVVKTGREFIVQLFEIYKNADKSKITGIHYFPLNHPWVHLYIRIGNIQKINLYTRDGPEILFSKADIRYIFKGVNDTPFQQIDEGKINEDFKPILVRSWNDSVCAEVVYIGIDNVFANDRRNWWLNVDKIIECNANPTLYAPRIKDKLQLLDSVINLTFVLVKL